MSQSARCWDYEAPSKCFYWLLSPRDTFSTGNSGRSLAILSRIVDTGMIAARITGPLGGTNPVSTKLAEILLEAETGISPQSVVSSEFETLFDSQSNSFSIQCGCRSRTHGWDADNQGDSRVHR